VPLEERYVSGPWCTTETTYTLVRTTTISTPALPAGLIGKRWILQTSVQCEAYYAQTLIRIVIDGVIVHDDITFTKAYGWADRATEVSEGTHTIEFYVRTTDPAYTACLMRYLLRCGLGTNSTSLVEVARIEFSGEFIAYFRGSVRGMEATYTIYLVSKVDDSDTEADVLEIAQAAAEEETVDVMKQTGYALEGIMLYARTTNARVAAVVLGYIAKYMLVLVAV